MRERERFETCKYIGSHGCICTCKHVSKFEYMCNDIYILYIYRYICFIYLFVYLILFIHIQYITVYVLQQKCHVQEKHVGMSAGLYLCITQ